MDKSLRWLRPVYFAAFAALCLYIGASLWGKAKDTVVCAEAVSKTVSESVFMKCIALREEEPVSSSAACWYSGEKLSAADNILTHRPAVYVDTSDGLEYLSAEAAGEMTAEELFSAVPQKAAQGRLIYGSAWYIAAVPDGAVPTSGSVKVLIDGEDAPLKARIVSCKNGMVFLRLTAGLEAHADIRRFSALLVTESFAGVEIPAQAVHSEAGETFVFTADAGIVTKKKAEIIYSENDKCISAFTREKDALCAGDTVIVSGENIYEGRVL